MTSSKYKKILFQFLFFASLLFALSLSVFANEKYVLIGDSYGSQEYKRLNPGSDNREVPITWIQNLDGYYLDCVYTTAERGAGFVRKGNHNNDFVDLVKKLNYNKSVTRVVVGGGTLNDQMAHATDEQIKSQMTAFNKAAKQRFPNAKIILACINSGVTQAGRNRATEKIPAYRAGAKALKWYDIPDIEKVLWFSESKSAGYFYDDKCHPNRKGQWLITLNLANGLSKYDRLLFEEAGKRQQQVAATVPVQTLRAKSVSTKGILLTWNQIEGTVRYELWGGKVGQRFKKIDKFVPANGRESMRTGLAPGNYYNYQMRAYDKHGILIGESRKLYIATKGGKYTNAYAVNVLKTSYTVEAGEEIVLIPSVSLLEAGKTEKEYEKYVFVTDKPGIAKCHSSGIIDTKMPGSCNVYVIAQSGAKATITLKIK